MSHYEDSKGLEINWPRFQSPATSMVAGIRWMTAAIQKLLFYQISTSDGIERRMDLANQYDV